MLQQSDNTKSIDSINITFLKNKIFSLSIVKPDTTNLLKALLVTKMDYLDIST